MSNEDEKLVRARLRAIVFHLKEAREYELAGNLSKCSEKLSTASYQASFLLGLLERISIPVSN